MLTTSRPLTSWLGAPAGRTRRAGGVETGGRREAETAGRRGRTQTAKHGRNKPP